MAIQYSGGTTVNDLYNSINTPSLLLASISTSLTNAGWNVATSNAFNDLYFSAQPADGNGFTLGGLAYVYKNIINNAVARQILIDTSLAATLANTAAAIIAGAGSGTQYSSATTANPSATAVVNIPPNGAGVTITAISSTIAGNAVDLASSGVPMTQLYSGNLSYWGSICTSALTPQGLSCQLNLSLSGPPNGEPNRLRCRLASPTSGIGSSGFNGNSQVPDDMNNPINGYVFRPDLFTSYRVIANKYQFFIMVDGVNAGTQFGMVSGGVPYVHPFQQALVISNASNTTPIVITTSVAHGYTTADQACVRNVQGNTAANTVASIIVIDANNFSLTGTVGNGAYTGGTGTVGKINKQVAEAIWFSGQQQAYFPRARPSCEGTESWCLVNGTSYLGKDYHLGDYNGFGAGTMSLCVTAQAKAGYAAGNPMQWYNRSYLLGEPLMVIGATTTALPFIVGSMWGTAVYHGALSADTTATFDGHNWWNLTDNNNGGSTPLDGTGVNAASSVITVVP